MSDNNKKFKRDIYLVIIDKFLLLVLIGIVGNVFFERYKAKIAFNNELNRVRVSKVAEVWEKAYLLDYYMQGVESDWLEGKSRALKLLQESVDISKGKPKYNAYDAGVEMQKAFKEAAADEEKYLNEFMQTFQSNRLWLDSESAKALEEYLEITKRYNLNLYRDSTNKEILKKLKQRKSNLLNERSNIREISNRLLEK